MRKTDYKHLVIARSEFLKLVGAPNESLRLIIIYYMFKFTFFIKTTLLEYLRRQKRPLKALLQKTSFNDFVLMRNEFLTPVGAPNECLRLIKIFFTFKYSFPIKTTFPESIRSQKSPLKAQFGSN